jgi:hypothetical protein
MFLKHVILTCTFKNMLLEYVIFTYIFKMHVRNKKSHVKKKYVILINRIGGISFELDLRKTLSQFN